MKCSYNSNEIKIKAGKSPCEHYAQCALSEAVKCMFTFPRDAMTLFPITLLEVKHLQLHLMMGFT